MLQTRRLKFICVAFLLACLLILPCAHAAEQNSGTSGGDSLNLVPATALDIVKEIISHRGKVVVVNFYAAWCPPCRREIPHLKSLREFFSASELVIIGVSLDESHQDYTRFVELMGITYPTHRANSDVTMFFKISSIPVVLYYDREGRLHRRIVGLQPLDRMKANIQELLRGSAD